MLANVFSKSRPALQEGLQFVHQAATKVVRGAARTAGTESRGAVQSTAQVVGQAAPRILAGAPADAAPATSLRLPALGQTVQSLVAPRAPLLQLETPASAPQRPSPARQAAPRGILSLLRAGATREPAAMAAIRNAASQFSTVAGASSAVSENSVLATTPENQVRAQSTTVERLTADTPPSNEARLALLRDAAMADDLEAAAAVAAHGAKASVLRTRLRDHGYQDGLFQTAEERLMTAHLEYAKTQNYTPAQLDGMKARMVIFANAAHQMRKAADEMMQLVAFSSTPPAALAYAQTGSMLAHTVRRVAGFSTDIIGVSARPNVAYCGATMVMTAMKTAVRALGHDCLPVLMGRLVSATGTFLGEVQESPVSFSRPAGSWLVDVLKRQFEGIAVDSGLEQVLGRDHPRLVELRAEFGRLMEVASRAEINTVVAYVGQNRDFREACYSSLPYGHEDQRLIVDEVLSVTPKAAATPAAQVRILASTKEALGLQVVDLLSPDYDEMLNQAGVGSDATAASSGLSFPVDSCLVETVLGTHTELQIEVAARVEAVREAIQAAGEAAKRRPGGPEIMQRHILSVIAREHEEMDRLLRS
jgi:hypothetical protein